MYVVLTNSQVRPKLLNSQVLAILHFSVAPPPSREELSVTLVKYKDYQVSFWNFSLSRYESEAQTLHDFNTF